ncbi:RagB/SusD family nutrient uptake outer membrane protein [Paraflavitalea speifideaquila]|uniref:RagB/SusD family nutrient uptake outer membrane protein n=1 Tax=Paraflavitalea speifideaquila TaxID=3076558 RepID=UPI0028E2D2E6|nr:RagB/SusD family nutrient uptake outer membrane protein [Paraflavitalea speifideiaquila]
MVSDNGYAGGDNSNNITQDLFTFNSLNENINRDWGGFYRLIARTNITINQVTKSVDPALSAARKNQILGEARFLRAIGYFDLVRMFGRVPIMLTPPITKTAEELLKSVLVPQSSADSVYDVILQDLWFAKSSVRDIGASTSRYLISKGAVNGMLAKVYAAKPTPNWDSVRYYCDQVIPNYALVPNYNFLWDNQHDNNSEAIWVINYDGWSAGDQVGNWAPSIFVGGVLVIMKAGAGRSSRRLRMILSMCTRRKGIISGKMLRLLFWILRGSGRMLIGRLRIILF